MTTKDEALKMALDALKLGSAMYSPGGTAHAQIAAAIAACREALAQKDELELAAKAGLGKTCIPNHNIDMFQKGWKPLEDDGEALRLAVKLRIEISHNHGADQQRWVSASRSGCEGCYAPVSCVEDDFEEHQRASATRLAIVRAAAEIGRSMP